jgi:hypothetical protein
VRIGLKSLNLAIFFFEIFDFLYFFLKLDFTDFPLPKTSLSIVSFVSAVLTALDCRDLDFELLPLLGLLEFFFEI